MAIKATKDELAIINERFAKEPLEEAYCIPIMAADTERLIDDRALKLHESTIAKFARDANERGPGLALTHLTFVQPIPIGKVFAGHDSGHRLYAKAYMPVGVTVPTLIGGEVKTDQIAEGYSTGLVDRVSIGFSFERAECNICFEDVRSPECPHSPGEMVAGDDGPIECTPIIYAGEKGRLDHIAIVWQGALDNAKTIKPSDLPMGFTAPEPTGDVFAKSESLPEVSMGQFSVQIGASKATRLDAHKGEMNRMTSALMDSLKAGGVREAIRAAALSPTEPAGTHQASVREEWPFAPEWFEHPVLGPMFDRLTDEEWGALGEAIDAETLRLTDETVRLACEQYEHRKDLEQRLETQALNIAGLQQRVESLSKLADLGTQYCNSLKAEALAVGVKCMGNAFSTEFYERVFTEALEKGEVNVVLAAKTAWESEFTARFPVGRRSATQNGEGEEPVPTTPDGKFDRLVRVKLKAEDWPFERYGDAASAVGREHPDLVAAMRARLAPHAE